MALVPLTIPVPTILGTPVTRVWAYTELRVISIGGNLRALTSGTHTVEIRQAGAGAPLIHTISWTSPGPIASAANELDFLVPNDMGLRIDVTSLGVGALDCLLTVWALVP